MRRFLKTLVYTVFGCASLLALFFAAFWIHMQLRIDTSVAVEDVACRLHVSPDKLSVLNEPCGYRPIVICKYLEDRSNILDRCESVIPIEDELKRLTESAQSEMLSILHREFNRIEKRTMRDFGVYGISIEEPIERLYYIKGGAIGYPVVVETKECIYVLCHINSM
jgi:hypothetical protein